jgi:hypothetical protein
MPFDLEPSDRHPNITAALALLVNQTVAKQIVISKLFIFTTCPRIRRAISWVDLPAEYLALFE